MQEWAKTFYRSKAWQSCRESYIQERMHIDGGICEVCKREQGYIVHHIEALTKENISNPLISLNHENLRYECKECHDREKGHYMDGKESQRKSLLCIFDRETGQPIKDLRNV
jgi:hypothetical protein